jgi:hypothetical protein
MKQTLSRLVISFLFLSSRSNRSILVSRRWPAMAEAVAAAVAGVEDVAVEEAVEEVVSFQIIYPLVIIPIQTDSVFTRLPFRRQLCTD